MDQAWHLHLCYTRSYWDELCGEVLGAPLHHGPTRGGRDEGAKFEDWYERTLQSYQRIFGQEPPSDIWPDAATRFGHAAHFRRVNLRRCWVLPRPKPTVNWAQWAPALLVLLIAGCGAASYGTSNNWNPFDWYGAQFLTLFGWMCALGLGFSFWQRGRLNLPDDRAFPSQSLDPYWIARLGDEKNMAIDAALAALFVRGDLARNERGQLEPVGVETPAHPFEARVWSAVGAQTSLAGAREELAPVLDTFDGELQRLGLLVAPDAQNRANLWPALTAIALCIFGAIKIGVGLSRGRPVGYLALACGALLLLAIAMAVGFRLRRSGRGDAYLESLRAQTPRAEASALPLEGLMLVSALALFGYGEWDAPGLSDLRKTLRSPSSGSDGGSSDGGSSDGGSSDGGSSDGGSSDGGSGCGGGGCGGCGGCGGGD